MQKRDVPTKCFGCIWLSLYKDMGAQVPICKYFQRLDTAVDSIEIEEDSCPLYTGLEFFERFDCKFNRSNLTQEVLHEIFSKDGRKGC